ncbi:1-deoxy-D-xylulose-5-phosphate reductoisomerase [Nesterenkonia alkaliphila]|uniref:1-deoxy-D-xylulose 5-phosphate reductoisomerase n=1 Tax=Nesterenkonia alkaliphila TaxID=1463631 RepID=A0A7K1UJZ8_9MICC|nr:1-deoxy-D-xylulose-5-phosphate reductoisomerase [Nesterenkonia alkaliphila]MVT26799.1 1-deoxy-D-xylulose-5-phosphate reductoisomerase [Nesterenkonia alkaliphila]GFZ81561.1 1-deoxy-D-xylulose 5-phosphate reductoisomerase [Nesterenkonia alkaliphila]
MSQPRRIAILGSTGSVGTQALEIIAEHPERFAAVSLSAGTNTRLLAAQVKATGASLAGIAADGGTSENPANPPLADALAQAGVTHEVEVLTGQEAAVSIAGDERADMVLNAMTGSIGLRPTLAVVKRGALLALANKESLIVGGSLLGDAVRSGRILPVDSEHSALWQALTAGSAAEVAKLILTASGGPFRGWSAQQLADVTPAQALAHPTWNMGRVVTTNSATMVNKALEVIEAHLLFEVPLEHIDVVVHPQSVVHSMVQYVDGSIMAQASPPDMRLPIALALGHPHRVPSAAAACDFSAAAQWQFEPLDEQAFPAVQLAKQAAGASGTHMAVYNAANEQAVEAFHTEQLSFGRIVPTVEAVLAQHSAPTGDVTLEDVLGAEAWARRMADDLIGTAVAAPGAAR